MVDNFIGDKEIFHMWQTHYKLEYITIASVETSSSKKFFNANFIQMVIR